MRVAAKPGEDIVVLRISNGPTLMLHPENARDLMLAQSDPNKRSAGTTAPNEVAVPEQLGWPGLEATPTRSATRGWLGRVVLEAVEVLTGIAKDKAVDLATAAVTKRLDGRVDAGVYKLAPDALPASLTGSGRKRDKVPPAPDGGPLLVLVHGTFVDTVSSFGKLWSLHAPTLAKVFDRYDGRVYALDHPTLGESPISNALTLARALPQNARLHLVTHSRGGMVAEVLARVCGRGVSQEDLGLFKDTKEADYSEHRAELAELAKEVKAKQLQVDRVVRVACPARGTLLASNRLDAYLSVLEWGLELANVPVAPELVDFLAEVARRRGNPGDLPGLEAMMPDRPLVQWLNSAAEPIPGQLRVVAGDIEGDSVLSWVKTLLSDAFYWTDNDLVVQTRSMYGGTPRAEQGASFVLDRGGKVTHFDYFANDRTVNAIAGALIQDRPDGFRPIGPLSWAGQDASGTRAARAVVRSRAGNPADRPAVFVLPGILGSNLAIDGKRVWLSLRFFNNLDRLKWDPNPAQLKRVTADGPMGMVYDDLIEFLADTHEVIPFGFDWRRPIEQEARRLADAVNAHLDARNASKQPVRMVAHSMGGVVARTMRLERPEVWQRMLARDGARVLMLGTPNGGSWAPMQVLSGDDTFGNVLSAVGSLFDGYRARELMAQLPGFIQLQAALLDGKHGLEKSARWRALADEDERRLRERSFWHALALQRDAYKWGVPEDSVLADAVKLRKRLDEQVADLGADATKMLLVVGNARFTPADVRMTNEGLEYLDAPDDGDGRVTLASAMLPGVRTWKLDVSHGSLPDERKAFTAYLELLTRGDTGKLPRVTEGGAQVRGEGAVPADRVLVPSRPSRGRGSWSDPPSFESDLFGEVDGGAEGPGSQPPLLVTVVNGNLKFTSQPLVVGHYLSTDLTGTERIVDGLIGGAMKASLQAGLYPTQIGSHQVFRNTWRDPEQPLSLPRPSAAIVVGLGEEGRLRMTDLSLTVRQGVIAHAQREDERGSSRPSGFELAATLIGSGGTGVSVGSAAHAIASGVRDANDRLERNGWPRVTHLYLVELYLDRATEAQRALEVLTEANPTRYALTSVVEIGTGFLRRPPDPNYRGASYDFVTAVQRNNDKDKSIIEYTLDTQRARTEVRGQVTQGGLVSELVDTAADHVNADTRIRRSLFRLLVPIELEPFLSGSNAVVLQLDKDTARIPWELLDPHECGEGAPSEDPWAVRTSVVRKLRTVQFRENPVGARRDGAALVIGAPQVDGNRFVKLPAAEEEAAAVAKKLGAKAELGLDALGTVNALLSRDWRIVHIAGHGEYRKKDCKTVGSDQNDDEGYGGVVLSNDRLLGPIEIEAMRAVPELVFINCCHIGRIEPGSSAKRSGLDSNRSRFAASIAEQLIRIGVRCVVAAGWAVEDRPAKVFAERFYECLLDGDRFIDAVGEARKEAYAENSAGNTWAAYQCYGDPDWRYVPGSGNDTRAVDSPHVVSEQGLIVMLETAATEAQYKDSGPDASKAKLRRLDSILDMEARYAPRWGDAGDVAEAFAQAYEQNGDRDAAIRWYERARSAADGRASFRAAEQLANLLARRGEARAEKNEGQIEIHSAIDILNKLVALESTMERENLLGSSYKRLAMTELSAAGGLHLPEAVKALESAVEHYGRAEEHARESGSDDLFYPIMNGIGAGLRLAMLKRQPFELATDRIEAARQSLENKATRDPDFWSVVGQAELRMLEALAASKLAEAVTSIAERWRDLKLRVDAPSKWDSVATQARFLLEPYREMSGEPESAAAAQLLAMLTELRARPQAESPARAAESGTPSSPKPKPSKPRKPARKKKARR